MLPPENMPLSPTPPPEYSAGGRQPRLPRGRHDHPILGRGRKIRLSGLSACSMFNDCYTEHDILAALHSLANGNSVDWDGARLDPDTRFYVLGLTPNTARLSVRFFWQNSFGVMMRNLQKHYERLNIVRPGYDPITPSPRLEDGP